MELAKTFSSLVDKAAIEARRPDKTAAIQRYVRATVRECQAKGLFEDDLIEDTIAADAAPFVWTPTQKIRTLSAVRYVSGTGFIYPEAIKPGILQREKTYFYYKSGSSIIFSGVSVGTSINVGYYIQLRALPYYPTASVLTTAPATYDVETDTWTYLTATTPAEEVIAREQVTNWLLEDWEHLILEGSLAKLYKSLDDKRAGTSFGLYKSMQNDLVAMATTITT